MHKNSKRSKETIIRPLVTVNQNPRFDREREIPRHDENNGCCPLDGVKRFGRLCGVGTEDILGGWTLSTYYSLYYETKRSSGSCPVGWVTQQQFTNYFLEKRSSRISQAKRPTAISRSVCRKKEKNRTIVAAVDLQLDIHTTTNARVEQCSIGTIIIYYCNNYCC